MVRCIEQAYQDCASIEDKNYKCEKCDAKLSSQCKHKGVKLSCEQCDFKTPDLHDLRIKNFYCEECDAKLYQSVCTKCYQ